MLKVVCRSILVLSFAYAVHAADSAATPEDILRDLVARQQALLAEAGKEQDLPEFDRENSKSQLQQLSDAYEVLLRDHPSFVAAHVDYAELLWKIDMRAPAVEQLIEANDLDKDIPVVKHMLGNYLAEEGKPVEALPYFMAAIELAPKEPLYHFNLGVLLCTARDDFLKSGGWTRAALDHSMLEAFRRAAELAPDRAEFTYRYAEAFNDVETPDWETALKVWRSLEPKVKPGYELQYVQLGEAEILLKQKKPDEARVLLDGITDSKLSVRKQKLIALLPTGPGK